MKFSGPFSPIDPRRADLERLKRNAKELQRAFDAGERGARELVRRHLQHHAHEEHLKLAYAQLVIARAHGFGSWPRLKSYVAARQLRGAAFRDALLAAAFRSNDFELAALYERRGELDVNDVYVAALRADVEALEKLIAASPELVAAEGGPAQCTPLVYLCHSRFGRFEKAFRERQLQAARLLLAHGADANAGTPKDEHGHAKSALYGSVKRPGHPELCELLLAHGARVSDGESLYHASELEDLRCLKLLLEHEPEPQDREWCIVRVIDHENAAGIRLYLEHGTNPNHLCGALFRERGLECLRALIDGGANVNEICAADWLHQRVAGLTPIQIAERNGDDAAIELLLAAGAADNRGPRDYLIGACARGQRDRVERVLAEHAEIAASLTPSDHAYVAAFARAGRREAVGLLLDAGFDIDTPADDMICSGFVYAAMSGDVSMASLLLARGANRHAAHKHGGSALGSAIYCAANFRHPHGDYAGMVKLLLGAGLEQRDDMLPFALDHGLDEIAAILAAHGGRLEDEPDATTS